jgi:hypothetical protein
MVCAKFIEGLNSDIKERMDMALTLSLGKVFSLQELVTMASTFERLPGTHKGKEPASAPKPKPKPKNPGPSSVPTLVAQAGRAPRGIPLAATAAPGGLDEASLEARLRARSSICEACGGEHWTRLCETKRGSRPRLSEADSENLHRLLQAIRRRMSRSSDPAHLGALWSSGDGSIDSGDESGDSWSTVGSDPEEPLPAPALALPAPTLARRPDEPAAGPPDGPASVPAPRPVEVEEALAPYALAAAAAPDRRPHGSSRRSDRSVAGPGITSSMFMVAVYLLGAVALHGVRTREFGAPRNVMALADSGAGRSFINVASLELFAAPGFTPGPMRTISVHAPLAPPALVVGHDVTIQVAANGLTTTVNAFATVFHGIFTGVDVILSATASRALRLITSASGPAPDPGAAGPSAPRDADPGSRASVPPGDPAIPRAGPPNQRVLDTLAGVAVVDQGHQASSNSSEVPNFHPENVRFLPAAVTTVAALLEDYAFRSEVDAALAAHAADDGGAFLREAGWSWSRRTAARAAAPRPSSGPPAPVTALAATAAPPPPPPPPPHPATDAPRVTPHPGAGVTVPLVSANGTTVGSINAGFTELTVADPARFRAQRAVLTAALRVNLDLPLRRNHHNPLLIPFAPDADFEASWTEARTFAVRERQAVVIDKLVTHGTTAGYLERWIPPAGDLLGRPAGKGYCLCPVFVVEKEANGVTAFRVVCDLRNANSLTDLSVARPTANMDDHIAFAMGAGYFNVVDASKSFYAVATSLDPNVSVIACFRHRGEIYFFRSLTMGGALSPGFYQVASDAFCRAIGPSCRAYIDDLVDKCPAPTQTAAGLWDVCALMDHCIATAKALSGPLGFLHNAEKSIFAAGRATVCGIICGQGQSSIPPATLARTLALDPPATAKDCQRLAGVFNDLAGHVPGLGACAGAIAQGGALAGSIFKFPDDILSAVTSAFTKGKSLLTRAVPLHSISTAPGSILTLYHDSCRDGMAYLLAEWDWPGPGPVPRSIPEDMIPNDSDPRLRIIRLGSKASVGLEKTASAYQCEMNGARYAYEQCRHLLLGRFVVAVSDHRAWCLTLTGPNPKPKNLRTLILATHGFRSQPVHKAGATGLKLTDGLSRAIRGSSATVADCIQYDAELATPQPPPAAVLLGLGFTSPPSTPTLGFTRPHPPAAPDAVTAALAAFSASDPADLEDDDDPEIIALVTTIISENSFADHSQKFSLDSTAVALATTVATRASARLATRDTASTAPRPSAPSTAPPRTAAPAPATSDSSSSSGFEDESPLAPAPPGPRLVLDADGFVPVVRLSRTSSGRPFPSAVSPDPRHRWLRSQPRFSPVLLTDRADLVRFFHGERGHLGHAAVSRAIRDAGNDWKDLDEDVTNHCRSCPACQVWNTAAPGYSEIPIDIYNEARPGMHLAADVMKMTPCRNGYTGVLIVMDVASRFVMAAPIRSESTEEITFMFGLMFSINGPFCRLTVDNNPVFAGVHVERLAAQFGAEVTTTSEYSSSNRVEVGGCKFVGDSLRKVCSEAGDARLWPSLLWGTIASLNSAYHFTASCKKGFTPFEVYHARPSPLALPRTIPANPLLLPSDEVALQRLRDLVYANDVLNPLRAQALSDAAIERARIHSESHRIVSFPVGTPVLVHRGARAPKWRPRWKGPYIIARRSSGGAYLLARRDGTFLVRRFPAHHLKRWNGPLKDALGEDLAEFIISDKLNELGQTVYLVHWYGYGVHQRTWEPASSFLSSSTLLEYHTSPIRPFPLAD